MRDDQEQPATPASPVPPLTGHPGIDRALADADFSGDVGEHPRRIEALLEALQTALQTR